MSVVEFKHNGRNGRYENFRLHVGGVEVGEAEFCHLSDGRVGVYSVEIWEEHRGKGHGRTLMEQVVRHLGGREAYLYVWEDNVVAMSLYEKFGFSRIYHTHESDHGVPRVKVRMSRPRDASTKAA